VEPVATHFHWAIGHCNGDPKQIQDSLINITEHYKNNHTKCHLSSRCITHKNHEPSRKVLTDPKAEKMLMGVITRSTVHKDPRSYTLARDIFYVESFNNTMNVFQDKRISFHGEQYLMRSHLAVLHWNENVDKEFTSVWNPRRQNVPRSTKGKKNYKKLNYTYRTNIWNRIMDTLYH